MQGGDRDFEPGLTGRRFHVSYRETGPEVHEFAATEKFRLMTWPPGEQVTDFSRDIWKRLRELN